MIGLRDRRWVAEIVNDVDGTRAEVHVVACDIQEADRKANECLANPHEYVQVIYMYEEESGNE